MPKTVPTAQAAYAGWLRLLEPADGGTNVVQHEVDRGIGLWFWSSDWLEPAYAAANEALAERVRSEMAKPGN